MKTLACSALATALSFATACMPSDESAENGVDAFTKGSAEEIGVDVSSKGDVVLPRAALGTKVYRLVATLIYAGWNAEECGKQPANYKAEPPGDVPDTCFFKIVPLITRRVTFAAKEDQLVMAAETTGDQLATFAYTPQGEDHVAFSFNPEELELKSNISAGVPEASAKVIDGKVRARKALGWVAITQDGELDLPKLGRRPGRLKWGLTAAPAPSKTFTPSFQAEGKPKYFFEVNGPEHPIAKFDFTSGQVLKLRNTNVPTAKRATATQALAASADYWNRVLRKASGEAERTFIEVETTTKDDAFAHDPGFNVVQWLTFEKNGTANGVFQNDADTGETLFGNAYISAGFFGAGVKTAKELYRFANEADAPEAVVNQFLADYMFETVAHEVGHVLGLQHDFEASNLAEGRTPDELPAIARAYFESGETIPDLSASVMEYLPLPLAGMLGGHMRKNILPHDLNAIADGYFGKRVDLTKVYGDDLGAKAEALAFCNGTPKTATCVEFDHPLCSIAVDCFPRADP